MMEKPTHPLLGELTPRERKIYERLLEDGESTAVQLSERASVEPGTVSRLVRGLVRRGFVQTQVGRPTRYRAVPCEELEAHHALPEVRLGFAYLVKEPRPKVSIALFRRMLQQGHPGLCITRLPPGQVHERWGFNGETLWLGKRGESIGAPDHMRLDSILRNVRSFADSNPRGAILLDGLEYLATQYKFQDVLRFFQDIGEAVTLSQATLFIPVNAEAFSPRDLALLEREMDVLSP